MRATRRARIALVAVTLVFTLLAAPAAWAAPLSTQGPTGWFGQLWDWVAAWVAPAATAEVSTSDELSTPTTWQPVPMDPASTDAAGEEDDRGATMDPNG